ncbi:MAG: N-6 DNA methylase, partial [Candidatus Moranbacteria bacterium GW2011_GWF2_37_11]
VTKQNIGNGRFNILAQNSNKIDVLVTGHMDTVQPNSGWTRNPIKPEVVGNKLYGLGTTDMKSGIAIMLYLTTLAKLKNNAGFSMVRDGGAAYPQQVQVRTLIVRDESKVIYMPESNWDAAKKGEELIRAQLYVNLIEKYQYPLHLVEFGRYVKVGHAKSKRYIEADIIINDEAGNARMILEVGNFEEFEENRDRIVADLFDLARAVTCVKKPNFLVYFSRSCKGGQVKDKIAVIDYTKFNTFQSWKKAKRPSTEEIPKYNL